MKLIPVMDLKGGQVVAARMGDRASYAPLVSPLCGSSAPLAVCSALLALHPFDCLYVADLDAIAGGAGQLPVIEALHRRHPGIELWVDSGLVGLERIGRIARPVIGTESVESAAQLAGLVRSLVAPVLSLDFRGDRLIGPARAAADPGLWPADVIVMTLARVGSGSGPDLALIERLIRLSDRQRLYAAGGIRDAADLHALRAVGAAGALVSTALHRGRDGAGALGLNAR
jgi:phosphoribosylformimino-5-aminoimidazole carboxamide ribotide isomerase